MGAEYPGIGNIDVGIAGWLKISGTAGASRVEYAHAAYRLVARYVRVTMYDELVFLFPASAFGIARRVRDEDSATIKAHADERLNRGAVAVVIPVVVTQAGEYRSQGTELVENVWVTDIARVKNVVHVGERVPDTWM